VNSDKILNIGVICLDAGKAATITGHISAITEGSRHHSVVLPVWPSNSLLDIDLGLFDALIIHYTIVVKDHTFLIQSARERIAKFAGLKVAFIQDEYRFINATIDALRELRIGLLFTCVPEPEIQKVYSAQRLPGMRALNVLVVIQIPKARGMLLKRSTTCVRKVSLSDYILSTTCPAKT